MKKVPTNENLVNDSNHSQNQNLINQIDNLLIERIPDLINDELKWIRKDYGNDELSEFLCGDEYYEDSVLLHIIEESINEHLNSKQNMKTKTTNENLVNKSNQSQLEQTQIINELKIKI